MMDFDIKSEVKDKMEKSIENLEKRFTTVRTGRANPSSLDGVSVEYYGSLTPLKQLVTISVPEGNQLLIKPFDKSSLSAIEKAIIASNLGYNPTNDGESIRNIRHEAMEKIEKSEISEDISKGMEKDVQDLVNQYNKKIDDMLKEKEKELLTV